MEEPSELGTSKERPIEIDEEDESSDENSVIILDSDTEKEDGDVDDGENGDDEDEDLVEDEEDSEASDEESEEDEEDSDSSVDSDSVNSVWSDVGEAAGDEITTEAAEAQIVRKFERAIIAIADNEVEKGRKILEIILDDPIISCFNHEDLDFEAFEEPPRLAKMLQIFIATHKNLAKLCEKSLESLDKQDDHQIQNQEIQHLCQVLAYDPNNSEIWLDVALKSVEFGDLNFAKYAFKRCENMKESMESHATLLYLTCDYSESLMILKQYKEQNDVLSDKMKYLKHKIRDTNQYYKLLCDRIFEEDEVYADIDYVEKRKILAFDERIEELKKKMTGKIEKRDQSFKEQTELMSAIPIQISADQDLPTVCTLFCDLFDRIHNFSHCREQLIEITEWESRSDYLQVVETVDKLVDIVECVEELTEKVDESQKVKKGRRQRQQEKKDYLANWRKRLFVEKTAEEVITLDSDANTTADEDEEASQEEEKKNGEMPANELADEFNLIYSDITSIVTAERKREKTPPPSQESEFISCDSILRLLEIQFSGATHTILEILEHTLLLLSDHSPEHGALPEDMKEVTKEMYYRFILYSEIKLSKFNKLNMFVMELGATKAMELMILKYISPFWKEQKEDESEEEEENGKEDRSFLLRFMWKYTQTKLTDEVKLDYLHSLQLLLQPEECIQTAYGSFATWDVDIAINELEKKKRIDSVKHLWKSKNYESLVEILQNDIDFSSIGIDEAIEMISYWIQSLEKMKSSGELLKMIARAIHFYLFIVEKASNNTIKKERIEKNLEFLLLKVYRLVSRDSFAISRRRLPTLSTIGYFICLIFKKYQKFEKDWKNWRILFEIVKAQRGNAKEYVESLDKNDDPTAMPLLELDLLVKAHEVLGEHECCAQRNYEFLLFIVDRIREIIDDIPFLEICYLKDNGYLWNNINVELSQILFCLFGKFSRKVRAQENHENGGKCVASIEIYRKIIGVILVHPLPLHDEKEKLTHDIVELLNSKFSSFLEISKEKQEKQKEFKTLLKTAGSVEEVNRILHQCQDDHEDDTQSLVWYAMALCAYRQNSFKEATKYSELYLLTDDRVQYERQRNSAWGMMAHASATDLLQLELHEMYDEWKWRIMPHRMAVSSHKNEPGPHFEIAVLQYQLATSLLRFQRHLPEDDPRRRDNGDVEQLREEARTHFDKALELTRIGVDGSQPEHHWLCYFFSAKLEAKSQKWDILKVVESFYEAACGCELLCFYYPQKVQTKKQQNFEPLEVHYQAFSAVYKYLINNDMPDLETLRKLKAWLKIMTDGHKVVKSTSSLFKVNIDVYTVVDNLVIDTVLQEKGVEEETIPSQIDFDLRVELVADLKEMCIRAFEVVTDRFPHIKSYYRLAQLYFEKEDYDKASDQIFKNAFKRKKRDDGMFDNCVEISSSDINRNGSNSFHIERCIKIGAEIVQKTNDLSNAVAMLTTMIVIIAKNNEDNVEKAMWKSVVTMYVAAVEKIVMTRDNTSNRSTPSPGPGEVPSKSHTLSLKCLRTEIWRLWQALTKCTKPSEPLIQLMRTKTLEIINRFFKSVDEFRSKMQPHTSNDPLKKNKNIVMKRKIDGTDSAAAPWLKSLVDQTSGAKHINDLALRLVHAGTDKTSSPLNDLAQQLIKKYGTTSPEKLLAHYSDLLTKFAATQKASTSSASQPSTSSASKPPVPAAAPKPSAPVSTTSSTLKQSTSAPSTSSAAKPQTSAPPTLFGPFRTAPRYSPISDDEVQCIDPPPAKKPALAPVIGAAKSIAAKSVPPKPSQVSSSSSTSAPSRIESGAEAPKQMVPSVFGGLKAAVPGQAASNVSSNPIRPQPQNVQKPSVSSAPSTSNPPPKPPAKPPQKTPEQASLTINPKFRAQFDTIVALGSTQDITQMVVKNSKSTDPQVRDMVRQALLYLTEKQNKKKDAASKPAAPPPKSQAPPTQPLTALAAEEHLKNQQVVATFIQMQMMAQAAQEKQAKEAKERAAKAEKERAQIAQENRAKEAKRLEKLAREAQAAREAKAAAEAKKTKETLAAAQLAQLNASQANFLKAAKEAQAAQQKNAQMAQQQQLSQQLVEAWNRLTGAGGMGIPSTSSAPNLTNVGDQYQKLIQAQAQLLQTQKPPAVQQTQKKPTPAPTRPIVIQPQIARPHPYKPKPTQPQVAQRLPTQQMRQSTSASALAPPNRPTTNQNQQNSTLQEQLEYLCRMDNESLLRTLSAIPDQAQRQLLYEQILKKKKK